MPAWILAALALIRGSAGRALGGPGRRALAGGAAGGLLATVGIPGVDLFPDGGVLGEEVKRRRRRRRALTASDRADIAFIQATLGQAAGRAFAMLVVSRTTA